MQARQGRIERVRIMRERQMELLRLILDDPDTFGPVINMKTTRKISIQQFLFCTMWVNYARTSYRSGAMTEGDLREDVLGGPFQGELLRTWWENVGPDWTRLTEGYGERKFARIVQDEYDKAVAARPTSVVTMKDQSKQAPVRVSTRGRILAGAAAAAAIGVILGSRMRRPHL
jgi:hypothetical protein